MDSQLAEIKNLIINNVHVKEEFEIDDKSLEEKVQKRVKKRGTGKCITCNAKVDPYAVKCRPCYAEFRRKKNEPKKMKIESKKDESLVKKTTHKPCARKNRTKGTGKCLDCNVNISRRAHKCANCVERKKKFEVTKKELNDLIWIQKLPYTDIAAKYSVSDNSIRKRCKALGIKVRTNKDV